MTLGHSSKWLGIGVLLVLVGCKTPNPEAVGISSNEELFPDADPGKAAETALATVNHLASSDRTRELEAFFRQGNYDEALEMARDLKAISEPKTEERDVAQFIEAVSLFYLGQHEAAAPLLEEHIEQFPGSRHRESAVFFEGSNLTKLGRWRAASEKLDVFLLEYPESVLMEYALYDRASAYLAMGENAEAAKTAADLQQRFVYSKIRDRAAAVEGDALLAQGELDFAGISYTRALEGAMKLGHPKTEARALRGLIDMTGRKGEVAKSLAYYEAFFGRYADSDEALLAAVAGLPAMEGAGNLDAGFERVEKLLMALPEATPALRIRLALNSYDKYYREAKGPDELVRQLGNLSSNQDASKKVREQIVVARLEALESYFPEREAEIRVFYDEIIQNFDRNDLSGETLVKIGDRVAAKDRVEAKKIYEVVLVRPGSEMKGEATLGIAKLDATSGDPSREDEAIGGFGRVIHLYGDVELAESATVELARLYEAQGEWQKAYSAWDSYLQNPLWTSLRMEAEEGCELAKTNTGGIVIVTPIVEPSLSEPMVMDPYMEALELAESLLAEGEKPKAFKILDEMLEGTDTLEIEPTDEAKSAIRQASLIHQDLMVELGYQVSTETGNP